MSREPAIKRTIAFVDGQNLFGSARDAFGIRQPSFDVVALARAVSLQRGWRLEGVRFYTGVPEASDRPALHDMWARQLRRMRSCGVVVTTRHVRRRRRRGLLDDGRLVDVTVFEEKGIDLRIALDVVRALIAGECDVVLLFSQDQDFAELADEVRFVARRQCRWVKIASAFPVGPGTRNRRGVDHTDWVPIDSAMWEACLDRRGRL